MRYGYEDDNFPERVLSHREHVARKQHTCVWCSQAIKPGERYSKWAVIDFDKFQVIKHHAATVGCEILDGEHNA